MIKVEIKGTAKIVKNLEKASRSIKEAVAAAIYQEAEAIMAESVREVPVDTGRLRATHYVSPPTNIDRPKVELGYGVDYALPVHERMEVRHPVGKAKFLEDPIKRARRGYQERLGKRATKNLKSGVRLGSVSTSPKASKG